MASRVELLKSVRPGGSSLRPRAMSERDWALFISNALYTLLVCPGHDPN